jgi:hypothetical protein
MKVICLMLVIFISGLLTILMPISTDGACASREEIRVMSNVLTFPSARIQSRETKADEGPSSGKKSEILLFLGVRYERHSDIGPLNASPDDLGRDSKLTPRRRKSRRRA